MAYLQTALIVQQIAKMQIYIKIMETHKQTGLLIERLKTSEIDNLLEVSEKYPTVFNGIFEDLKNNRYWNEVMFDTVIWMCNNLTLNGKTLSLYEFSKFFK